MGSPPESSTFVHNGRRLAYREYGSGPRAIVLTHGLLMDGRMYTNLAPALAERGYRVLTADMLGHGDSAQPHDMTCHSMTQYGLDVVALLDHLGIAQAVVGGTSLGANVALELAVRSPERVRGLFIEMPVLDNALPAVAAAFAPLLLGLRLARPAFEIASRLTSAIPRTHHLADMGLDWVRQRPGPSGAVLEGLLLGETAPHREERRQIRQPTLIVGHPRDPVHPFSDSGMLAEELPNARLVEASSILEWRLRPGRLDSELGSFLAEVWSAPRAVAA